MLSAAAAGTAAEVWEQVFLKGEKRWGEREWDPDQRVRNLGDLEITLRILENPMHYRI